MDKTYIAIDLKSFYASVECVARGLDPMSTNLVVADASRTEKTICLAVTPALKSYGIPGRARLFEVVQRVREVNRERLRKAPGGAFRRKSSSAPELSASRSKRFVYSRTALSPFSFTSFKTLATTVLMDSSSLASNARTPESCLAKSGSVVDNLRI